MCASAQAQWFVGKWLERGHIFDGVSEGVGVETR